MNAFILVGPWQKSRVSALLIKLLWLLSLEDEEFKREAEVISHVRHRNLVKLLGYCAEGDYR